MSGKASVVERFESMGIKLGPKKSTYFAELKDNHSLLKDTDLSAVKKAAISNIDDILHVRGQISEFSQPPDAREKLLKVLESNSGRTFYIEEDRKMVSIASTTAENSISAMIVGVATLEQYRGRGYASLLVSAIAVELLSEGKALCLFYDNPAAGKIYKRLGFKDIGMWNMYR